MMRMMMMMMMMIIIIIIIIMSSDSAWRVETAMQMYQSLDMGTGPNGYERCCCCCCCCWVGVLVVVRFSNS